MWVQLWILKFIENISLDDEFSLYLNNWNFLIYFWFFIKMILVPELTESGLLFHFFFFFATQYLKSCLNYGFMINVEQLYVIRYSITIVFF